MKLLINLHLKGFYSAGELDEPSTHKKFLLVRQEGVRQVKKEIEHYNLDVIITRGRAQAIKQLKNIQDGNTIQ